MDLPSLGTRLSHRGDLGTVRYLGPVDGTTGTWLGIEWDNPDRGKHDGTTGGKRYFIAQAPKAGSFIRPSASISYGRSFLDALGSKYTEQPHGSGSPERVLLGSSHGAIEVEAVRLDKIRQKLSALENLREASLDNENVAKSDPPGTIKSVCPSIRGLDLSLNLLESWDDVAKIAVELPKLERLALNRNRLRPLVDAISFKGAFLNLAELQLNGTMTTWTEMDSITMMMPRIRLVEMGYNNLSRLATADISLGKGSSIQAVNLDSNRCRDWVHLYESLKQYNHLQRIILTANGIGTIPFPGSHRQRLDNLKHLSLSANNLCAWHDINAVAAWCPALQTLSLNGNPLMSGEFAQHSRPFTIARIPSLLSLDGATISSTERNDSEIFYLSHIANYGSEIASRAAEHPQWPRLCQKHGQPDESHDKNRQERLSKQLIEIECYNWDRLAVIEAHAVTEFIDSSSPMIIRLLQTMTIQTLRLKMCKALKQDPKRIKIDLWLRMMDDTVTKLDVDQDNKELGWLGIEAGSQVVFQHKMR